MKYNFTVPSMWIQGTRAPIHDSDYASLGIATVAPDGTIIDTYDPITRELGSLESGLVDLNMELTDIDVPDDGSMAVVFTVMNKGTWSGHGTIIDALDKFVGGLVGALAGGQIAGQTNPATTDKDGNVQPPSSQPISPWWAGIAIIASLATFELVKIIWPDCDGWVVNATMTFGRTELDKTAGQATWSWTTHYHGSDSSDGCGSTSDYLVNYQVLASALPGILVPNLLSHDPQEALAELTTVGLSGEIVSESKGVVDSPQVYAQSPKAGIYVLPETIVELQVMIPSGGTLP